MPADNDFISEVLEKMIDSQIANTQALTALKSTLDENNERLKDIDSFFRNGFRQDIKQLVSESQDSTDVCKEGHDKTKTKLNSVEDSLREIKDQNKVWARVVAAIVAFAAIAAAVVKIIG